MTSKREQRVYLHVGLPKTGTTYLQERLWRNVGLPKPGITYLDDPLTRNPEVARRVGLMYPGRTIEDHFHAAAHLQPDRYLDWVNPDRSHAWQTMVAQMRAWPGASVVSHELFATATPDQAAALLADLDFATVHIVVTVRDLVRQIPSVWQENVKNQYRATFDDFVTAVRTDDPSAPPFWEFQDYPRILQTWAADLPPEQVHVVTVPQPGSPDTMWSRFLQALEVPEDEFDRDVESSNSALTPVQVELLRRLNAQLQPEDIAWDRYEWAVKRFLIGEVLFESERVVAQQLLPSDRAWVAERSEQMVDQIIAAGYRVVGSPDDLRVAAVDDAPAADPVSDPAVLAAALDAIVGMLKVMDLPKEKVTAVGRAKAVVRGPARRALTAARRLRR